MLKVKDCVLPPENGRCLGWRAGPDQPYQWLSYQEVSLSLQTDRERL